VHRPAGGPLIAVEPEHDQPFVDLVRADQALGRVDHFLDLGLERVDDPLPTTRSLNRGTSITGGNQASDGLGIDPGQLRRRMRAAGLVECFEDFHDLPGRLFHGPSGRSQLVRGQRPRANRRRDHY
jgi:hypothetical protein